LNELFHKKQKVPKKFIEYKGIKYYPRMFLRCRKYIKPIGKDKCKLFINFLYLIEKITKKNLYAIVYKELQSKMK
jgi:hypothetical protein